MGYFVISSTVCDYPYGSVSQVCSLDYAQWVKSEQDRFQIPGQINEVFEGTYQEAIDELKRQTMIVSN